MIVETKQKNSLRVAYWLVGRRGIATRASTAVVGEKRRRRRRGKLPGETGPGPMKEEGPTSNGWANRDLQRTPAPSDQRVSKQEKVPTCRFTPTKGDLFSFRSFHEKWPIQKIFS